MKRNKKNQCQQILVRLTTGVLLLFSFAVSAQQLSPEIVSSGGGSSFKNSVYLDYSIGQIADELISGSGTILTQGFLQGNTITTAVFENNQSTTYLKVYPVPTTNRLFVEINRDGLACKYTIRDIQSKMVKNGNISNKISQIGMDNLKPGIYFLTIYFKEHQPVTNKIIKQ